MNARFVILRVMLEAGEGLVQINRITGEDGEPDLQIILDRSKITPVGKPAIGNFLRKLQVSVRHSFWSLMLYMLVLVKVQ